MTLAAGRRAGPRRPRRRCATSSPSHADETALVTVMWANNEVGTIMPIAELAAVAAEFDVPMHSDAVQAVAQLPVDFAASGLSALSIAAHKFGGPQGVGALLLGRQVPCVPLLHGGGHERDLRSGTPDTARRCRYGGGAARQTVRTSIPARRELTGCATG